MKRLAVILFIASLPVIALAQKEIPIHDELNRNGIKMKVKMGIQSFDKLYRLKFGEYAVTDSKIGPTKSTEKGNIFGTKSQSKTTNKFTFLLNNAANDVAYVKAEKNITGRQLNQVEVIPHFSAGENELLERHSYFAVVMNVNNDTASTWTLILKETSGTEVPDDTTGVLTNGNRKISVTWISSARNNKGIGIPAMGYAFEEGGKPLSAVQYYGGGMLGLNKNLVWMHPNNDNTTKLVLAAAMTAILQTKLAEMVTD